jgi:subtilisin family serine protease
MNTNEEEFFKLLPYTVEDVVVPLSLQQTLGWHISAFNLPSIWKISQGENVKIAIIDSGCDLSHPDLQENLIEGKNFVEQGLPPEDATEHGTHVAGIIAGSNNEFGIAGVAPKAKIMPLKVLNSFGLGSLHAVEQAIYYAVDNGADLISMSLGTRNPAPAIEKAIEYANSKSTVCFVAAGNAGSTKNLLYPAAYTSVISIGAVDEQSMRADFSCTGPNLDFVAPGVRIYSTVPKSSYAFLSGTSMACPFALATAALVLSQKRKDDPNIKMNIDDYRAVLKQNTIEIKNLDQNLDQQGKRFWQGMGIINPSEFSDWVEYRNVDSIKKELLSISDRIGLIKNKSLLRELDQFLEVINSKVTS